MVIDDKFSQAVKLAQVMTGKAEAMEGAVVLNVLRKAMEDGAQKGAVVLDDARISGEEDDVRMGGGCGERRGSVAAMAETEKLGAHAGAAREDLG